MLKKLIDELKDAAQYMEDRDKEAHYSPGESSSIYRYQADSLYEAIDILQEAIEAVEHWNDPPDTSVYKHTLAELRSQP